MARRVVVSLLLAGSVCVVASPASAQPDPRTDWFGYQSWCIGQGGYPYNDYRGVGCDVPARRVKPRDTTTTGPEIGDSEESYRRKEEADRQKREAALQEMMRRESGMLEEEGRRFEAEKGAAVGLLKDAGPIGGETPEPETKPELAKPKEVSIEKGYQGSAPPYLADLDPKWPLVVDPAKVQGRTPAALRTANRRTHFVLDALEAGKGDWRTSLRFLDDRLLQYPNDTALRDAHAYVFGMYTGFLGAAQAADRHYRYGVREWLEGDFEGAARAFARAAADNPDDKVAFATYAETLGLLHGRGGCRRPEDCRGLGDLPRPDLFTAEDERQLRALEEAVRREPRDLQRRLALGVLEGWVAFGDWVSSVPDRPQPRRDAETRRQISTGLNQLMVEDYGAAMRSFGAAHLHATAKGVDDRGLLFATRYAEGRATGARGGEVVKAFDERARAVVRDYMKAMAAAFEEEERRRLLAAIQPPPRDRKAFERVRQEILDLQARNPFFGVLSDEEVAALYRGSPIDSARPAPKAR